MANYNNYNNGGGGGGYNQHGGQSQYQQSQQPQYQNYSSQGNHQQQPPQQNYHNPSTPGRLRDNQNRRTTKKIISLEEALKNAGSDKYNMYDNDNSRGGISAQGYGAAWPNNQQNQWPSDAGNNSSNNYSSNNIINNNSSNSIINNNNNSNVNSNYNNQYCEYYNENNEKIEIDGTKVIALWSFQGEMETDLRFNEGDIITVIRRYDNGWWEGEVNGVIGDFPSNYVEICGEEEEDDDDDDDDDDDPNETDSPSSIQQGQQMLQQQHMNRSNSLRQDAQPAPTSGYNSSGYNSIPMSAYPAAPAASTTGSYRGPSETTPSFEESSIAAANRPKPLPIKEGFLQKKGHRRRNWKVRYFVLENNVLSYYSSPTKDKQPKGMIPLHKSTLVKLAPEMKRSNCFTISIAVKPFIFYVAAPTGEEMVSWMDSIMAAKATLMEQ